MKRLEIINTIHSCVQVAISIAQKWQFDESVLLNIGLKLLLDVDMPIDTCAASGIMIAHLHSRVNDCWIEVFVLYFSFIFFHCEQLLPSLIDNS